MKQNILLLLVLLLFASASCSPRIALSATPSPTKEAQKATIPVTATSRPTTVPTEQALRFPPATPSLSLPIDEETIEPTELPSQPLIITIVYDNNAFDERLKTAWGFSALVEYQGHTLLFDTGGDGPTLMENMRVLEIDPGKIETVVLSHAHGDHTGGLHALLDDGVRPVIYLPPSFPVSYKRQASQIIDVVEVEPGQVIAEGIYTTGEMGQAIAEQALVIKTKKGLVIITGCAHPGITEIVKRAQTLFNEPVHLVLGGFHLGEKSQAEIDAIIREFHRLKVEQVAPCHCTGAQAIASFAADCQENCLPVGAGRIIRIDDEAR